MVNNKEKSKQKHLKQKMPRKKKKEVKKLASIDGISAILLLIGIFLVIGKEDMVGWLFIIAAFIKMTGGGYH